jgi:hypothetical protein
MKTANDPLSPAVRLAHLLLYQATDHSVAEIRLSIEGEFMMIAFDGRPQPTPKANVFSGVVKAILNDARVLLWPWSRGVSGKRLDFESRSSAIKASWVMETQDIRKRLTLTRMDGNLNDGNVNAGVRMRQDVG